MTTLEVIPAPEGAEDTPTKQRRGLQDSWFDGLRRWQHLFAVLWVLLLELATLGPALTRGWMIGTYDLLSRSSLTSQAGVIEHGSYINTDPIVQMIPWTTLNWTQVHQGFLPLWNPYNGLGLPLAFNWQSASFSLPSLIGYLLPVHSAYTAGVLVTLFIAGTGAYVLGRTLRFGFFGAIMVATIYELSGPLISWLGYPQGQVMSWGGWLFAAAILVIRGSRRGPSIALFSFITAFAIYAGHPESLIVMEVALGTFVLAVLVARALPSRLGLSGGPIRRPAIDLVISSIAGCALGAPLLLPALQLTSGSVRSTSSASAPPPVHDMLYLVFSGFDGIPVAGNFGYDGGFYYNQYAAYVGIIAVVLALLGVVVAVRRRQSKVLAVAVVVTVTAALSYLSPAIHLAEKVPLVGDVDWLRALMPLSLGLAVLAGAGASALVQWPSSRIVRRWSLGGFGVAVAALALVWLFGRNGGIPNFGHSVAIHVREISFIWPAVGSLVGLAGVILLRWKAATVRLVAVALILAESAFLITSGAVQIASSTSGITATPAVTALQRAVGDATVASGQSEPSAECNLGVVPEANMAFGIHEIDLYDPIAPKSYYTTWVQETGTAGGSEEFDQFCPSITTVAEAQRLGAQYVVEPSGHPGPRGSTFVTKLATPSNPYPDNPLTKPPVTEDLYRIPHSAQATLIKPTGEGAPTPPESAGTPVTVKDPNPAKLRIVTNAPTARLLRVHRTNVPGWHATIDGRPLVLDHSSIFELEAKIPAGHHVIEFTYWPPAFTAGLLIALATALVLLGVLFRHQWRRRHTMTARRETE